ncbi:MAG: PASTA domain-containing protein [Deltaproteobacteria bacterium]|nr:PASTA domain-containing protein [Deltaproteobacteria bacterium]
MSRTSSTVAISITTSLITSAVMFLALQFWLVPLLEKGKKTEEKTTEVPKIIGLSPDQAQTILKEKGLLLNLSKKSSHPTILAGLIHHQDPLPKSILKKGTAVSVEVSNGPPKISVPLVVGKNLTEAQSVIIKLGLAVNVTYREDSESKANQILSQDPPPGREVEKSTQMKLVVSKKKSEVEIPAYRGKIYSKKKMTEELEKLGLKLGKVNSMDTSDRPNGYIYSTKPKKGEKVAPGTEVNFNIQYSDD